MEFIYSTRKFVDGRPFGKGFVKGDVFIQDENCFFFKPTLYEKEKSTAEYYADFLRDREKFIANLNGEFLLFFYDSKENNIVYATDRIGKELGWYFFDGKDVILTNAYWEGIKVIAPEEKDIDIQSMKEIIVYNRALLHNTIVKNYRCVPPSTFITFDLSSQPTINETKYWNMEFKPNLSLKLNEVVDRVEQIFDNTYKMLSEKYSKDTRFGVGLSGGLDSRLTAHYALKHGLKLVPYCIGQKYLRYPITTNGYNVAMRIARYFKVDKEFKFINHDSEPYMNKVFYDVYYLPFTNSSMEFNPLSKVPEFDIMLNGEHGGVFFGEFDFRPLLNYNKEDIDQFLLTFLCPHQKKELILSSEEEKEAVSKVKNYIKNLKAVDRYEVFYQFFFEIYGSKTQRGFFESNYGIRKSYTQFLNPEFVNFFLTWDPRFLVERALQKALFVKHYTILSKMQDENSDAPLYWRGDSPRMWLIRFYFALKNKLRKKNLRRGEWTQKSQEFKQLSDKVLSTNQDFLKKNFPKLNFEEYLRTNSRGAANLLKMKIVVDIILSKGYDDIQKFMESYYGFEIQNSR